MYYLNDLGLLCNLGSGKAAITSRLLTVGSPIPEPSTLLQRRGAYCVGEITAPLKELPPGFENYDCRNNRLAAMAVGQIRESVDRMAERLGHSRVGVVMATSTSGIVESERAVRQLKGDGSYPSTYHATQGMLGGLGEFVTAFLKLGGPSYTLSTACSSSANAALSARRMIRSGICDAVVFGGVDSLCEMTLQGFGALGAQSSSFCRPFASNRDGINIGEGAAVFLLSREARGARLVGGAGSSDAHHISAPHPEGDGAFQSMDGALQDAGLEPGEISYINLHGTATQHNDCMESKAVYRLFGDQVPCSSTKSFTGHTLGAAGALELGFCWLLLEQERGWRFPPSLYLDDHDPGLSPIQLVGNALINEARPEYCLSNSFAFGGSNVSLIIGRTND